MFQFSDSNLLATSKHCSVIQVIDNNYNKINKIVT